MVKLNKIFVFLLLGLFMISFTSAFNWADSISSYYKLDETSGTVIDSLNLRNGTNVGATPNVAGLINTAYSFDGTNDNINSTHPFTGDADYTISTWIHNPDNYEFPVGDSPIVWMGGQGTDIVASVSVKGDGSGNNVVTSLHYGDDLTWTTDYLNKTGWNHVLMTYTGSNNSAHLYLNGVDRGAKTHSGNLNLGNSFMGIGGDSAIRWFNGTIDEVGIWNKSLSPSEATELYNNGAGLAINSSSEKDITLVSPINGTTISDVGTNFTVTGKNVSTEAATWNNVTYNVWQNNTLVNSTTISLSGETFNETQFIDDFSFKTYEWNAEACYTNVTGDYCVSAENNNTLSVSLFTIVSESYVNDTISGTLENFSISIDLLEGYSLTSAGFMYNGTTNSPSITAEGDNRFLLVSNYQIPILTTDQNISFYWDLGFSGSISLNSTERTQLVRAVLLDNCSAYSYQLFNISLFDEELKTSLNGDIEITYTLLNLPNYQTINTFSFSQDSVSNVGVCSGINLSAESLAYSAEIRYVSDGYAPELYHIQRAEIGDGVQSINLYDLHNNESTEFKITYQDDTFNFVEGAIVQLQRKYISEGIYRVVEAPLTSRDGVAVVHIDLDSIKYKATVVKNGVVLDVFDNLVFKCESELTGECTQKLLGGINPQNSQEVSNLIDFSYVLSSVNNTITTIFTIPSGTPSIVNIVLTQADSFGKTTLCNSTVTSSAGSIDCTYNATIGDSNVFLTISKDGVMIVNQGYFIPENLNLGFAGNNYLIVLLLLLTLVGMAFASPEWIVIIGIVAFVIAGGMWLINGMNLVIGLGMMIFVLIAAVILIKEMTKQEDQ